MRQIPIGLLCSVVALCLSLQAVYALEQKCEPGSQFLDEQQCNTCTCGSDGVTVACTKMACVKFPIELAPSREKRDDSATSCVPNSRYKHSDGCNWCTCTNDGKAGACTRKFCVKREGRSRRSPVEKKCEPSSRFRDADGCNWCTCSSDGTMAACTRKLCIPRGPPTNAPVRVRRDTAPEPQVCVPNTSFMDADGCNSCFCNEKGTLAACTLKYCFKINQPTLAKVEVCEPNKSFKKDCNTCVCNSEGTAAACTEIGCSETLPKIVNSRVVRDAPVTCQANSTFKADCNTCVCNADGTAAACTEMACPPKICEPNKLSRAQDACNTCRCNAEGTARVCTTADCPALAGTEETECTPNSVFKKECNTCKCSSDGKRAFCTRRKCRRSANEGENENKEVATEQPTPCTPDDIKIEGCNRCKCAKNGIVWLCTPGSACAPNGNGNNNHH